jgi:predicted PurR-regulated permease PerM
MRDSLMLKNSFFYIAAFIVIIAGIKMASHIVVLVLLSIFIALISSAVLKKLISFGFPKYGAYGVILFLFVLVLFLFFYIFSTSLGGFLINLPIYEQKLVNSLGDLFEIATTLGIEIHKQQVLEFLDVGYLLKLSASTLGNFGSIFSKILVLFIAVSFILVESEAFHKKILALIGQDKQKKVAFELFYENVQSYFIIKTFTSGLTGGLIFVVLLFFDIEYPLLWAVLAFVFNFIPVVGSIIAAIPAIILALIQADIAVALWMSLLYVVVNISISNVLEPKFMGDGLGLSATVIFFSLIFWGYVLGIAGMFLAVPITMTMKVAFDSMHHTRWLANLMAKG